MSWIAVGVGGAALLGGGTALGGSAADKQKKKLKQIANTPGLDIGQLTGQALTNQQVNLPAAQQLVSAEATGQQDLLNSLLEQSMPGFGAARSKALDSTNSLLAGEIPADVSAAVQRSDAARALGGGYGGSGMHRNLVARDLGLTSLDLKSQGLGWLQALRGMSPMAQPQSAFSLAGPNANDLINIRGQERAQRMNILTARAGIKGQTGMFGDMFQNIGGMMLGGALTGGMGGGMGGGGAPSGNPMPSVGYSPGDGGWASRVGRYGFSNNWYLGQQPGPG